MQIAKWIALGSKTITQAGITNARLDCLLLLEDITGHDRGWLLAHDDELLDDTQLDHLASQVLRRVQHEPLAYIRGFSEFYGRRFTVNSDVLVPRPESESMVSLLLQLAPQTTSIADIGTGSGCLAITAALQTGAVVYAVDIDEACLKVAAQNAVVYTASVQFLLGNLLTPLMEQSISPDVLLANLPYVPENYPINDAARHEPSKALFAGDDGLNLYRSMFEQLVTMPVKPKLVITEALLSQHDALALLALEHGYGLGATDGLVQAFCEVTPTA